MNNNVPATRDVDPLGYGLTNFHNFESYDNLPFPGNPPTYNVKQELYQNSYLTQVPTKEVNNVITQINAKPTAVPQPAVSNANANEDIKPDVFNMRKTKIKRERSKYFSEKITDKDFKFYGCTLCNISFATLQELDTHVLIHKERVTSYDLRIKSRIKKKKMLKELLKKEKMKDDIKTEDLDIEIKPEDGYIGNEKALDVINTESDNQSSKENKSSTKKSKSEKKVKGKKLNNKDDELKIYKCFGCEKQFTLSYYLKLHVRSHTDEKPYTCAQCGQSFITASKLGRHNKRFHLAIRYQCRICYRYFSRFEFLTHHFDKKHPDDKLEGEPYDFNAILPYLKELEEQMQEKNEIKEKEKEDPKIEDIWNDSGTEDHYGKNIKIDVQIEEVKVDMDEIEVKIEAKEEEIKNEDPDNGGADTVADDNVADDNSVDKDDDDYFGDKDDVKEESDVKDENLSDDDYFPLNTWASTPKIESPPTPPKPKDKLQCPVCEKKISTVSYLKVHMRTHTGERPFKCYVCNAGFITSSKMHRHVLTHPESVADTDIKSEKVVIKSENEKDENDEDNKDNKPIKKIKKSMEKFSKKSRGMKKEKLYKKRPHACDFCHKRFLHLETLQVHKKSHEGETKSYECKFCLTPQEDAAVLETHEATHTGPKPYLCTVCGKSYKNRESMVYHRKNHKPEKEFQCDICTKSFNAQCKLQRHIVSHRVDRFILRYECPVCAHMFNTKYHMQMHLNTHQKEGLIQEENRNEILAMVLQNARKIPKKPDTATSLTDVVPNDERSRVCNICGEVFQHFYYLEEHLKSHGSKIAIEDSEKEEEKKHICKVCNKGFKLHYYLKLHSFTHTKEKPFICQQCGKGFITRGKLKRHLETHTGLKKYQCHICYKFFTRPSYLRIHVRTIHGTQDYNFRLDKVEYSSSVHDGQL